MMDEASNKEIKLVLSDFDGVLFNGKKGNSALEKIIDFSNKLLRMDISFAILTGCEDNEILEELKRKGIRIINHSVNKVEDAKVLLDELKVGFEDVLFIGDDILDIPLLQKVKISVAPKNARREVKRVADYQVDNGSLDLISEEVFNILS